MADKKEDKKPDHISKYQKLTKKTKQMLNTMERHHRQSYDSAIDSLLMKDGQVQMEELDKKDIQDKFAEKMSDFYIGKAKSIFKTKDEAKFDDLEKELLMNAYVGTTKAQLLQHVRSSGKGFTFSHFYDKLRPSMMESIQNNLEQATISHFKDEHIGDIIKYTKSGNLVDSNKVRLQDAIHLLGTYEGTGAITKKMVEKTVYYKKPKKE